MDSYESVICQRITTIVAESKSLINLIGVTPCIYTRNILLYKLVVKLNELDFLSSLICNQTKQLNNIQAGLTHQNPQIQTDFTLKELSKFNGKDSNPAYVAIDGAVYDVTNNAAWAAASHFGLTAGKDLSAEFTSCHSGQPILNKLKVVGKLVK